MEERWTAFVNGETAEQVVDVVVVSAFLEPACTCGSLCMGRYRFWYEHDGSLFTVDVDRIGLDWAMEELLAEGPYAALPRLVRDWNEDKGWCAVDEPFGSAVTAADVTAFADALRPHFDDAFAAALRDLARKAAEMGSPMKAMTD